MKTVPVIAIVSKLHDAYKDENKISLKRELGSLLAKKELPVLADFSPMTQYVKESLIAEGGRLTSLSPASKSEEHITIFRLLTLPGEAVVYAGLGQHMTFLTLLRSADVVICLDDASFREAVLLSQEGEVKLVKALNLETLKYVKEISTE